MHRIRNWYSSEHCVLHRNQVSITRIVQCTLLANRRSSWFIRWMRGWFWCGWLWCWNWSLRWSFGWTLCWSFCGEFLIILLIDNQFFALFGNWLSHNLFH